jgi:ADP-ribose pyrophosphatase YjhB (NUDIX family)
MTDRSDPPASALDPAFARRVPSGDSLERDVCERCGFVAYENPKIVVGSVVRTAGGVLMCRRAIAPRIGFWTLPAGYLEIGETPEEGARREAREEASAEIVLTSLLAVYTIRRLSQVQLIYRADLDGPFAPGPESLEVDVFCWDALPWERLAFPSVAWALEHERAAAGGAPLPFTNPVPDGVAELP